MARFAKVTRLKTISKLANFKTEVLGCDEQFKRIFCFIQVHEKNKIQAFLDSCEPNTEQVAISCGITNIFCGIKSLMFLENYACSLAMVRYSSMRLNFDAVSQRAAQSGAVGLNVQGLDDAVFDDHRVALAACSAKRRQFE